MTNLNPTEATTGVTKGTVGAAALRTPSQVVDMEVRGVTPKVMEVGPMVEETNVKPHSLSFWFGILRCPLLDGGQTQGQGDNQGYGGGAYGGGDQCIPSLLEFLVWNTEMTFIRWQSDPRSAG